MTNQRRLLLGVGLALIAIGFGYLLGRRGVRLAAEAGTPQLPSGWVEHRDPMGFAVSHPRGWQIRSDPSSGRSEVVSPQREQVVVWPVFLPAVPTGRRGMTVALDNRSAPAVVGGLVQKVWPNAVWGQPQRVGTSAIKLTGSAQDLRTVAVFTWANSPKGSAGFLYGTAAPQARYHAAQETFAKILESYRVTGTPAGQQLPALSYVRWSDPRENAFSLEVPRQWQVTGGLFRFASVDTRSAVEAASPDGQIRISLGDAQVPPFTEPTPMLEMTGFREGSWYSPGYGVQMMVRRYVPGTGFAAEQVRNRIARGCSALAPTETRDRADLVEAINKVYAQYGQLGFVMRLSAGEMAFTCQSGGRPMRGYYFAATQLTRGQGTGLWTVPHMGGFISAAEKAGEAQAVLEHMVQSVELNPQWVAMQSHLTAETSRIVSRTGQEISRLIDDTYWRRQGVMDELDRRRSNVILGVEDVVDPVTGRQFKVESGSNYYWIDHRGNVAGTDTDTRPNLDFRELIQLP